MNARSMSAVILVALSISSVACSPTSPTASPVPPGPTGGVNATAGPDDLASTRTLAAEDGAAAAGALAAAIVDAPDIDSAYTATADALARAGIRIETTEHVFVEPVLPAAGTSMWPRQVLVVALEAQDRRYVDRISATDAGTMLAGMGWTFPAELGTPGDGWLAFLRAWLADATASPGDPTSFAPLFAAELIRRGDGIDLATARTAEVRFGLLELLVLSAGFQRLETSAAVISLAVARPAPGDGRRPGAAAGPCDSVMERYGIAPDLGLVDAQPPAWMQKGAVGLLGPSSSAAKLAMKAVRAFQKIWRAAAFYFYSFVRVEGSDKSLHKPNEDDPEIHTTFTAKTGVDPDAFKEWVKDNGGPNGVRELNDDTRCAEALGMPSLTDVGDVAEDVENWIVDWEVLEGMPEHAELATTCGSAPTSTCNRFDRSSTLGMKLRRTGASVAEADLFVKIKEERKSDHTKGAVEREVPVSVRAKVDASSMPSISPLNLTNPAGLIGPGLEAIAGLVQSSFKPSAKATVMVTYHQPVGWILDDADGLTGTKCGGLGGDWIMTRVVDQIAIRTTVKYTTTIDETTLVGTYRYKAIQVATQAGQTLLVERATGAARLTLEPDGSVIIDTTDGTGTIAAEGQEQPLDLAGGGFHWRAAGAACATPGG